jgi:hypothetical protein
MLASIAWIVVDRVCLVQVSRSLAAGSLLEILEGFINFINHGAKHVSFTTSLLFALDWRVLLYIGVAVLATRERNINSIVVSWINVFWRRPNKSFLAIHDILFQAILAEKILFRMMVK